MKKIIFILTIIIVLGIGWYLGSPLFIDKEINEDLSGIHIPTNEEIVLMTEEELAQMDPMMVDMIMDNAAALPDMVMEEEMPLDQTEQEVDDIRVIKGGVFQGADSFHKGSGRAAILDAPWLDSPVLRFEDFSVTNGPDLRVLLVAHPNPAGQTDIKSGSYIELEKLKGNKGNQNYIIPQGTDVAQYQSVVIYCKPFHVVFATAVLQ